MPAIIVQVPERRHRPSSAFALLADRGPLRTEQVADLLYPGGTTTSRTSGGQVKIRNPTKRATEKLQSLAAAALVEFDVGSDEWRLGVGVGDAWVLYFAGNRIIAAVYDASLRLRAFESVDVLVEEQRDLEALIRDGATALAAAASMGGTRSGPAALTIALPAPLDHRKDNDRVRGPVPEDWHAVPSIRAALAQAWTDARRSLGQLPELPRCGGQIALCIETDVAADTLAAMHTPRGPHADSHPAGSDFVLGVKHTGGVRSAFIKRGDPLFKASGLSAERLRRPGVQRDTVFRGAFGDATGLGHSLAAIHQARKIAPEDPDFIDIVRFCDPPTLGRCSCRSPLPHLDNVVSAKRVGERLELGPRATVRQILDAVERAEGHILRRRAELILEETGLVVGYAIDVAIRLYDPGVVLVTGTLPHSEIVWNGIKKALVLAGYDKRPVVRAKELGVTDIAADPIGPRGAA